MAGGIGSRFWPISTPQYPKQFIDILGCGHTLIQLTYERFLGICSPENFWVVTNAAYVDIVKEQLPNIPEHHILAEPVARNTAPCIAWACWEIQNECMDANVVVTPADSVIMDTYEFKRVITEALLYTLDTDVIVTIGVKPNRAETGFGYIEVSSPVKGEIHYVKSFKEKPNKKLAEQYFTSGNFLWNAGIFVWNLHAIVNFINKYTPDIAALMDKTILSGKVYENFPLCDKISIDYAVLEPASKEGLVYAIPSEFGWSDLGNWASLHDKLIKDINDNSVVGKVKVIDCSDCIINVSNDKNVVLQGLDGYIVAEKNGCFLVCKRSEEQRIKDFI